MKALEEILNQPPVFLNDFSSEAAVVEEFSGTRWGDKSEKEDALKLIEGKKIMFASYGQDNYSGDAFVLLSEGTDLKVVHGSHCSCYGLEGQFEPEPTTLEALEKALVHGKMGVDDWSGNNYNLELKQFLGIEP